MPSKISFLETNVALIILRCDAYLRNNGLEDTLLQYPQLFDVTSRCNEEDVKKWSKQEEIRLAIYGHKEVGFTDDQAARYFYLLYLLGEGDVVRSLLDLAIASFYYSEFDEYLENTLEAEYVLSWPSFLRACPFPMNGRS